MGSIVNTSAIQFRARDVQNINSMIGKVYQVYGYLDLQGPGEATFPVNFPVSFIEFPTISHGFHLADGQLLEDGNFPTLSIGATNWVFTEPTPGNRFYTGALLVVVCSGHNNMQMTAHYQITGKALVNPIKPLNSGL